MFTLRYGSLTDRGDVRTENQDSILCLYGNPENKNAALFVVADGMGGLSYGSMVSTFITDMFEEWWNEDLPEMVRAGRTDRKDIRELLEQEIWDINNRILEFKRVNNTRCGSTLSLLLIYEDSFYIENMGDSRIYMLSPNGLRRLTVDQTLSAQLLREGRLSEEELKTFKKKNVLTMCVGLFEVPESYFNTGELRGNETFMLCSDGLYNALSDEEIDSVLERKDMTPGDKVDLLRKIIPFGEGRDNVSIIVAEVSQG